MSNNSNTYTQFELFPSSGDSTAPVIRQKFGFHELRVSRENCIVGSIICIMCMIFMFSLGVERGKGLVKKDILGAKISPLQNTSNEVLSEIQAPVQINPTAVIAAKTSGMVPVTEEKIEVLRIPEIKEDEEKPLQLNNYTIQVASFKKEYNAEKEALALKNKGHEAKVVSKGDYSIVCVGNFIEKNAAQAYTRKLKGQYKDLVVRRL